MNDLKENPPMPFGSLHDPAVLLAENTELRARLAEYENDPRPDMWMQTFTGRRVFPTRVTPADVDLADIAHALAYQCRFNGHCSKYYSVAEHCVLIAEWILTEPSLEAGTEGLTREELALWGLLHDATETYVGDMISPLKVRMPAFRRIERSIELAIAEHFHLKFPIPTGTYGDPRPLEVGAPMVVHDADKRIILDERRALFAEVIPLATSLEPLGVRVRGLVPHLAEHRYLSMFRHLAEAVSR